MPVNSFESYPMSWKVEKSRLKTPLYLSLAAALEEDIRSGVLTPHTQLPPQRELADFLDIGFSTISRALKICEEKELIYAVTGRGTFVAPNARSPIAFAEQQARANTIELDVLRPLDRFNTVVAEVASSVLAKGYGHTLLDYSYASGMPYHIDSAWKWLEKSLVLPKGCQLAVTSGAQNTILLGFTSLFQPGDRIAVDSFIYPNFIVLANLFHIQLVAVPGDSSGMLPEALSQMCDRMAIQGIYCTPACNNPTAIMMDETRRRELASVIQKHNLILLENDIYGFLTPEPIPPIQAFAPQHTLYIHSLSKSLCSGLRIAFAVFPERFATAFIRSLHSINIKAPALNAEIMVEMINGSSAAEIISEKRQIMWRRNECYDRYFGKGSANLNPNSFFRWLPLPVGTAASSVESAASAQGVSVLGSARFLVHSANESTGQFLRIALCSPETTEILEKGLQTLDALLFPKAHRELSPEPII